MNERLGVAVVGAGPAGLAAAWRLIEAGARVRLYERRAEPGGRLRTDVVDGVRIDPGVQLLAGSYRRTFELARAADVDDLLVPAPGRDALWRRGRANPITYGSIASMTTSAALPAGLKFRLATRYVPFLRKHADALELHDPARVAAAGLDRESAAEWGRREIGDDFVELLAYPLLGAYYGAEPEGTSAGLYHALARMGLDVRLYGVRGGMGALARGILDALVERGVEFRSNVEVRSVTAAADGAVVRWTDGEARHDAAVLAVPAPAASRLLDSTAPEVRSWLDGVRTRATASLALLLDRPAPADYFGLSFPRTAPPGERIVAICTQERKVPGLVPDGRGAVVVLPAPSVADGLAGAEPDAVLERLLPAVETAWPGVRRHVSRAKVYRFDSAYALFEPGGLSRVAAFDATTLPSTLALAGDYFIAPTVEGAVRSGRRAAARLLAARSV